MLRPAHDRLITAEELAVLPDDHQCHELVAGHLLSEPPASWNHGGIAARLFKALREFADRAGLRTVVSTDTGFILARDPDTVRAPDVAFVSRERTSLGDTAVFFPGPPDLAVELRSPGDRPGEIHAKVADYLTAGTRLVWVVDPASERVSVYRTLLHPRILTSVDRLEGEDVLPGFSLAVAEVLGGQETLD